MSGQEGCPARHLSGLRCQMVATHPGDHFNRWTADDRLYETAWNDADSMGHDAREQDR